MGVGTRHQPHSARSCELTLRAVGAARGRPGGLASLARVWGVQCLALTHARPPVLGACGRGLLPTGFGCGKCGRGDPSQTPKRALLRAGSARCGSGTRAPRGGRLLPGCGASRAGRSPTPDRQSLGRAAGARYPLAAAERGVGVGTRHQPHSGRSCELALRAVGAARGRPGGGGVSCLGVGRPGLGTHRHPTACPWDVRPGPATCWLWVREVWAWGPVTNPTARALASWLCALWGWQEGGFGGAFCLSTGRPGFGALPRPTARPLGLRPWPATHTLCECLFFFGFFFSSAARTRGRRRTCYTHARSMTATRHASHEKIRRERSKEQGASMLPCRATPRTRGKQPAPGPRHTPVLRIFPHLAHPKIKRTRTLRLGEKNKIEQSLSPSQVCMLHVTPRTRDGQRTKVAAKEVCGAVSRASRI